MSSTPSIQHINGTFSHKDILSLDQFSAADMQLLFSHVPAMKHIVEKKEVSKLLAGLLIGLFFYEPSSRTFSSFAAAVKRLGGQTLEYQNPMQTSSAAKGETLQDAIKVFETYTDAIIIRHPEKGTAKKAADAAFFVPVFNAGDGIGEHPTQALLDLYTIYEKHKTLDNLTGVLVGDIKNGRTVHSLLKGFSRFQGNTMYLLSPHQLRLCEEDKKDLKNITIIEIDNESQIPPDAHFWYWTRVQKERFEDAQDYEKLKHSYILSHDIIKKYAGTATIFMHPLPRVGEILEEVDHDPRALYLRSQIQNGLFVRMTLLALVLGKIQ